MGAGDCFGLARAIEKCCQQAAAFNILNRPFRKSGFSRLVGFDTRLLAVIWISCEAFRVLPLIPDKPLKHFQLLLGLMVVIALGDVDVEANA
jgi:hypothetical protein